MKKKKMLVMMKILKMMINLIQEKNKYKKFMTDILKVLKNARKNNLLIKN